MPRLRTEKELNDGWTRLLCPAMPLYRMGCCDCGLVHDMEFQVRRVIERKPDGTYVHEDVDDPDLIVAFRARRNNRSTAALRRGKAKRAAQKLE